MLALAPLLVAQLGGKKEGGCVAPCTSGKYKGKCNLMTNLTACGDCPAGYYTEDEYHHEHKCGGCPEGKYQASVSKGSCSTCGLNSYSHKKFSTSCSVCPKGYLAPIGAAKCETPTYAPTMAPTPPPTLYHDENNTWAPTAAPSGMLGGLGSSSSSKSGAPLAIGLGFVAVFATIVFAAIHMSKKQQSAAATVTEETAYTKEEVSSLVQKESDQEV